MSIVFKRRMDRLHQARAPDERMGEKQSLSTQAHNAQTTF